LHLNARAQETKMENQLSHWQSTAQHLPHRLLRRRCSERSLPRLCTSLDAIATSAKQLQQPLSQRQRCAHLQSIERSALYLHGMLENFFDVSRKDFAKSLQPRATRVQSVLDTAYAAQPESHQSIELLQPSASMRPIWVDPAYLNLALDCLLDNALQYSRPTSHVTLWAQEYQQNSVCIALSDVGCGIPEADQEKVFEPFWPARDRGGGGLGLGLYLAKRIVNALNGDLWMRSYVGVGTTFYLWLPTAGASNQAA
jgi:signal transduction histidine kinase